MNIFDDWLLSSYGKNGDLPADVNFDGTVNIFNLSILLSNWGRTSYNLMHKWIALSLMFLALAGSSLPSTLALLLFDGTPRPVRQYVPG